MLDGPTLSLHEDRAHRCARPRCWLATIESAAWRCQGAAGPMDGLSPRIVEKHDLPIQGCMPRWDGRTPPSDSAFRALCPPYERSRVDDELRSPYLRSGRRPAPQKIKQSGPTSRDRTAGGGTVALRLRREMLSAGMLSTRHYDPALSRQPGATRSPD
jgi:hypothetical protein